MLYGIISTITIPVVVTTTAIAIIAINTIAITIISSKFLVLLFRGC